MIFWLMPLVKIGGCLEYSLVLSDKTKVQFEVAVLAQGIGESGNRLFHVLLVVVFDFVFELLCLDLILH